MTTVESTPGSFDYLPRTRLIFGNGSVDQVGELVQSFAGRKVLLVTDKGLLQAGHVERVAQSLEKVGLHPVLFTDVQENPTTDCVEKCVQIARAEKVDFLIGLGGGSSMDTAKGCNFIYTNGGEMKHYKGKGKASKPMLPMIAIPTTGGTGSECQSYALIADAQTHLKMACGDYKAAARVAVLDPTLTLSQPRRVTACTGIDAITHALETAVTKRRTPLSSMFSREAFRLLAPSFPKVLSEPNHLEARGQMLLGAALAGTAIENSMLGAAHAAANPLTAHAGLAHGHAVGLMMRPVIGYNADHDISGQTYLELVGSGMLGDTTGSSAPEVLCGALDHWLSAAGLPTRLADCGVKESQLPRMAEEAALQWTAEVNPRPVTAADFLGFYQSVL